MATSHPATSAEPTPDEKAYDEYSFKKFCAAYVRTFYSDGEIVVFDAVVHLSHTKERVKDFELAVHLNWPEKDVRVSLDRLMRGHIIELEITGTDRRQQTFFKITRRLVDNCKWKLMTVSEQLRDNLRRAQQMEDYKCNNPKCKKVFKALDAMTLLDPTTMQFKCNDLHCDNGILEKMDQSTEIKKAKAMSDIFTKRTRFLKECLKQVDGMPLPDPSTLKAVVPLKGLAKVDAEKAAAQGGAQPSGSSPPGGSGSATPSSQPWPDSSAPQSQCGSPNDGALDMSHLNRPAGLPEMHLGHVPGGSNGAPPPPGAGAVRHATAIPWLATMSPRGSVAKIPQMAPRLSKGPAGPLPPLRLPGRHGATGRHADVMSPRLHVDIGGSDFQMTLERLRSVAQSDGSGDVTMDEEMGDSSDPTVMVQGNPYKLSIAREDDDLLEKMTDDEYTRFYELDK